MRVAAIYDIHGNLPALEAVLEEIDSIGKVDQIVVGGDVIPGPQPRETIAAILQIQTPTRFIYGNGERAVLDILSGREPVAVPEQVRESIRWAGRQLDRDQIQFVRGWPATVRLNFPTLGEMLFCHATPKSDTDIFTRLTPANRLIPIFADVSAAVVICGHTHMQFDRQIGDVRVVNAGSVGMPFGEPGAYWLLIDSEIEFRRTEYDPEKAMQRILATDFPDARQFVTRNVLEVPSAAEMLEVFERSAV